MTFLKYTGFGAFPGVAQGASNADTFGGVDLLTAADAAVQIIPGATSGRIRIDNVAVSGVIWNGTIPTTQLAPLYLPFCIVTAKVGPGVAVDAFLNQLIVGAVLNIPPSLKTINAMGARLRYQQLVGTGFPNFGQQYGYKGRTLYADVGESVFLIAGCMGNVTAGYAAVRTLAYLSMTGDYEDREVPITMR